MASKNFLFSRARPLRRSFLPTGVRQEGRYCIKMITFTPLSGSAHSSRTVPLSYLLQVDDVRILLDCGSPDWNPENIQTVHSESGNELAYPWTEYCDTLRK